MAVTLVLPVTLVVILVVILVVLASLRIVPAARVAVVERLGKYRTTLNPGVGFLLPFVDRVRARVDMREKVIASPAKEYQTADGSTVSVGTNVAYQVVDPVAATYAVSSTDLALEQLTVTALRDQIGRLDAAEVTSSWNTLQGNLRAVLDDAAHAWGVRVARAEITEASQAGR